MGISMHQGSLPWANEDAGPEPVDLAVTGLDDAARQLETEGFLFAMATLDFTDSSLPPSSPAEIAAARERPAGIARDGFLLRRQIVRAILTQLTEPTAERIAIWADAAGRPIVSGASETWYLSFAARGPVALIGLSREAIGVDLEVEKIVDPLPWNMLRPDEREAILSLPESARNAAFLRLWGAKEACAKLIGTGFATPPEAISLSGFLADCAPSTPPEPGKAGSARMMVLTRIGVNVFVSPALGGALDVPARYGVALASFARQG